MNVGLLGERLDWTGQWTPTEAQRAVFADLEMQPILEAALDGQRDLAQVVTRSWFEPVTDAATLVYRQQMAAYATQHLDYFRQVHQLAKDTGAEVRRNNWLVGTQAAAYSLSSTCSLCARYLKGVAAIRALPLPPAPWPAGLTAFHQTLTTQFGDGRLAKMQSLLADLSDNRVYAVEGRLSASLGSDVGEREVQHVHRLLDRVSEQLHLGKRKASFTLSARDDNGTKALVRVENQASYASAKAMMQIYHALAHFFAELEAETGWLIAVGQLSAALTGPQVFPTAAPKFTATGLTNAVLQLQPDVSTVIGNALDLTPGHGLIITGANQGGKTTFLRAVGQAVLMGEAGMPVCAEKMTLPPFDQVLTHFKREEDAQVVSGKLDEELKRMRGLVDQLTPQSLVLMNESFSSTNEHEGSQINSEITGGLLGRGCTVVSVSHQFEYTQLLQQEALPVRFLRAERAEDGSRSFKLMAGAPLPTSYGQDIFDRRFGALRKKHR
ncbi:MutS-related protein [Lacticaseibacillus mingshuiensis]|uniref:MutS-related protein n=1 Tax=Lacticaseibacillus mingshuiensis TaxID=2799574 RepID=UPI001941090D|nr:DNA mismatch repair protein MutS [Lacticaseibacillus mingshuiensis]